MNKKRSQIWVDPLFHKELKLESVMTGKKMEDITKDLGIKLQENRSIMQKPKRKNYEFL